MLRNELVELYRLACANANDKDIVRAYQRARDRIGPQIAVHEAMDADALSARVTMLEEALREIAEMKIPYCDADDVANSMRDTAKIALEEK